MPDAIHIKLDRLSHIVTDEFKSGMSNPLHNIDFAASEVVIEANHLFPSLHHPVDKMGTKKTGSTSNKNISRHNEDSKKIRSGLVVAVANTPQPQTGRLHLLRLRHRPGIKHPGRLAHPCRQVTPVQIAVLAPLRQDQNRVGGLHSTSIESARAQLPVPLRASAAAVASSFRSRAIWSGPTFGSWMASCAPSSSRSPQMRIAGANAADPLNRQKPNFTQLNIIRAAFSKRKKRVKRENNKIGQPTKTSLTSLHVIRI